MKEAIDLVIGTAYWITAFLAYSFPIWGPVAGFLIGLSIVL